MKNFSLKRWALSALVLLSAGAASAVTETYDFVVAENNTTLAPTYGESVTTGGAELQLISTASNNFGNRFAVGPTNRNDGTSNGFIFRTTGDYKGLWSQHGDRNFSILNLVKGNRVTITISKDDKTLKFVDGDAVVSGKTYTVPANGNLDFITTGGVYIEKVVIEDPVEAEALTIGIPAVDITYDFTTIVPNSEDKVVPTNQDNDHKVTTSSTNNVYKLATSDNDFDNRFGVGGYTADRTGDGGFHFYNHSGYVGLYNGWSGRTFSVLDLKKDDKVTITISHNGTTLAFFDKDNVSTYAGDAVTSGQTYTVTANGSLDFISTGSVYIEKVRIQHDAINIGGATLVSSNALDFTDATIKAYVASAADAGTVTFKRIYKVPANTPLYLKAASVITEEIPVLDGTAETITTNLLKGSASSTTALQSNDETKYYVFGVKSGVAGFYPVSNSSTLTSAAGKAYLELTAEQVGTSNSRLVLNFDEDSQTTGIATAVRETAADNIFYNLSGQRVNNPSRGLYIVNGKKVIIK